MTRSLDGRVVFITGATRGIGRSIALRCAQDGAAVVVTGKTSDPHPKLPGTIHSVADEVRAAGGKVLALQLDIRDDAAVEAAMEQAASELGGIDVLVNNASAISMTGTLDTPLKRFDLMFGVNVRGTFACSRAAVPYLRKSSNAHILTLSPPLNLASHWFAPHVAYTMAKYGMSMCTLGMSEEFREDGIAVNSLWPRTAIATAAIEMLLSTEGLAASRKPEIVADAAHAILTRDSRSYTGHFAIDDEVLAEEGITDLSGYAVKPGTDLFPDFFLD